MTKTAVIVQARFGSTRLPGKVLMMLDGRSVLSHVLERCKAIPGADVVCCAVSETLDSAPVAAEAQTAGVSVFRGSETDVLGRYLGAAEQVKADVVLRITSDCPLIDPVICGEVLALRAREKADYACNVMPRTWPQGLDCEAFTFEWLARAAREATNPYDHEHVTPFIREHAEARTANLPSPDPALAQHRWTLDTPADLTFFEALWPHLSEGPESWSYSHALAIVQEHPEIASINTGKIVNDTRSKALE